MEKPDDADKSRHLSEQEASKLRNGIELLQQVIKSYPSSKTTDQVSIEDWTEVEEWARTAMNSTHMIVDLLGLLQARSAETRSAFFSALSAHDRVMGVLESRYKQRVPDDYATAKLAVQTCLENAKRLL